MPLTIDIDVQVDVFRDAARKSIVHDLDASLVKGVLPNFTKYTDGLIPALVGGTPGTPEAVDVSTFNVARGLFVLSNLDVVCLVDFGDGNGVREIPIAKADPSSTSVPTYARLLLEVPSIASLSFRNDGGTATSAEIQWLLWGNG